MVLGCREATWPTERSEESLHEASENNRRDSSLCYAPPRVTSRPGVSTKPSKGDGPLLLHDADLDMKHQILFLEQQSWRAGAERVLEEVLRSLAPEFRPVVAFPEDGPFAAELRRHNVETVLIPLGRYRSGRKSAADMIAFPLRSVRAARRIAELIRQRDVWLVYINSPRCLLAGVMAARFTRTPSLFHLHMTMTRAADLFIAAQAGKRVTKIVACSETAAQSLAQNHQGFTAPVQVIYNPVRRRLPTGSPSGQGAALAAGLANSGRWVVGVVGRVTWQKGQHVLLNAAAELCRRGHALEIVFVGAPEKGNAEDAAYVRHLQSAARKLGLERQVHWAGYQEDPNIFYAILDALVIPSIVSEGLPLVALEALQWGVPVIGSSVGGIPEIVQDGENGFLTPPSSSRALADCFEHLLSSSELRAHLQAGARASVDDRFSVDTFRREIRQVLFNLTPLKTSTPMGSHNEVKMHH